VSRFESYCLHQIPLLLFVKVAFD